MYFLSFSLFEPKITSHTMISVFCVILILRYFTKNTQMLNIVCRIEGVENIFIEYIDI